MATEKEDTQELANVGFVPEDTDDVDDEPEAPKPEKPPREKIHDDLEQAWEEVERGDEEGAGLREVYSPHKEELAAAGMSATEFARASKNLVQLATADPTRVFTAINEFKQGQRMSPVLEVHFLDEMSRFEKKHKDAKLHQNDMGLFLADHPPKKGETTRAALARAYKAVLKAAEPEKPKNPRRSSRANISDDLGAVWNQIRAQGEDSWR